MLERWIFEENIACASPVNSIQTSFYYSNLFELDYRHVYYSHITLYHRFYLTCNGLPHYKNSQLQCKSGKCKHFSASIHPMNHPHRKHFELIQFTFHSIELTKFPFCRYITYTKFHPSRILVVTTIACACAHIKPLCT